MLRPAPGGAAACPPLIALAAVCALGACDEDAARFGAPCRGDRDCNAASYCVAGCGEQAARCVPYGADEDRASYRPVECCAGALYYTGMVSDAYKARLKDAVASPVVRDAARRFPQPLVSAVAADQAQQCLVCDGRLSVAPMGARCAPPAALAPLDAGVVDVVDGGAAGIDGGAGAPAPAATAVIEADGGVL